MATTPTAPRPLAPATKPTFGMQPAPKPAIPVAAVPPKPKPEAFKSPYANKTVKELSTKHVASMFVVDLEFIDGTHYYIKTRQGVLELGGTADWDTGAKS
jgi:hypothetical protein